MKYFEGKTIWITGASSGIGENLALALAPYAKTLILSARNSEALANVKSRCSSCRNVLVLPFDLANEIATEQAVSQAFGAVDRVDILFNNGGISQRASAMDTDEQVEKQLFQIN